MGTVVLISLGLSLDKPIGTIAPYLTYATSRIPVALWSTVVSTSILGDDGGGIGDLRSEVVGDLLADTSTIVERELPASVTHLGIIGLRRLRTEEVGKG